MIRSWKYGKFVSMLKPNQTKDTGIIQEDLEKRKQLVFNRARGDDDSSHGTKFRTTVHINPHMTVSPIYVGTLLSIPDRTPLD